LTVDNVARRSGVHKTTIYRRWKDREGLVADAVADRATTAKMPFPDTGDIDTDLLRLARMTVAFLTSPAGGTVAAAAMSDAGRIPEVAGAKRRFFEALFRQAEPVVSGAIARGELPADTDPAELIRTLLAPIYQRAEPYAGSDLSAPARAAASATLAALSAVVLSIGSAVTRSRR